MIPRSFRAKIFLLMVAIVATLAGIVMVSTHLGVEATVLDTEDRAARTIVELVKLDVSTRYDGLLRDKLNTLQLRRSRLEGLGDMLRSGVDGFVTLADEGVLPKEEAQRRALAWVGGLKLGGGQYAFVYDRTLKALSYPVASGIGRDLSPFRDFKARPVAAAMLAEVESTGRSFATYRWPKLSGDGFEAKFGLFMLNRAWDWALVIADDVQDIENDVNVKRAEIVRSLSSTLGELALAQSGFVMITQNDGTVIVSPPARAGRLVTARDAVSGKTLLEEIEAVAAPDGVRAGVFTAEGETDDPWEMRVTYFKSLDWFITAMVPRHDFRAPARALVTQQIAVFLPVLLVGLAVAYYYSSRLVRPLKTLAAYARSFATRDLAAEPRERPAIAGLSERFSDEVGRLAGSFLFMEGQLQDNVQRLMRETSARERIESELAIARDLQFGLLPDIEVEVGARQDVVVRATIIPAKEVGGDLYDVFMVDETTLCFAIGDVSGKGVPAAFIMAVAKTLLRASVRTERSPGRVLDAINAQLSHNNPNLMFVTLFVGLIDLATGRLDYANAGHIPAVVVSPDGTLERIGRLSGPACGVVEDLTYLSFETSVARGSLIAIYTDGVSEALDPDDALFGEGRTEQAFSAFAGQGADATLRGLLATVERFVDGAPQADDLTVLLIDLVTNAPHNARDNRVLEQCAEVPSS